jgi:hypothetical protein
MIVVKICRLGSTVQEIALEDGSSVGSAFRAAKIPFTGCEVNGVEANESRVLYNNDRIFIGSKVKGNIDIVEVKLTKIGSETATYSATAGQSIEEFLNSLGSDKGKYIDASGTHIYDYTDMGGSALDKSSYRLSGTSVRIMLSKKIKGNK